MCGCLLCAPNWEPGLQPTHVPCWESNRWPFVSQACAQSTEPHQPGPNSIFSSQTLYLSSLEVQFTPFKNICHVPPLTCLFLSSVLNIWTIVANMLQCSCLLILSSETFLNCWLTFFSLAGFENVLFAGVFKHFAYDMSCRFLYVPFSWGLVCFFGLAVYGFYHIWNFSSILQILFLSLFFVFPLFQRFCHIYTRQL